MGEPARTVMDSAIFEADDCNPCRIVLREVGGFLPFATHLKVYPRDEAAVKEPYHVEGHYFEQLEEATRDFGERVLRLRRSNNTAVHFDEARAMGRVAA